MKAVSEGLKIISKQISAGTGRADERPGKTKCPCSSFKSTERSRPTLRRKAEGKCLVQEAVDDVRKAQTRGMDVEGCGKALCFQLLVCRFGTSVLADTVLGYLCTLCEML